LSAFAINGGKEFSGPRNWACRNGKMVGNGLQFLRCANSYLTGKAVLA